MGGEVAAGEAAAFEEALPAIWEADLGGVREVLEAWRPGDPGRWPGELAREPAVLARCVARIVVRAANRSARQLYGVTSAAAVAGVAFGELHDPGHVLLIKIIADLACGRAHSPGELTYQPGADGRPIPCVAAWRAAAGSAESWRRVVVSLVPGSEALRGPHGPWLGTDEYLRALFTALPVAIGFSRDGVMLDVNPAYVRVFGYERREELVGTSLLAQIAPEWRADVVEKVRRRAVGDPVPSAYRTVGLRKDGSEFPFVVTVARIDVADGPLSMVTIVDVSEHERMQADLVEKMGLLELLFESSPVGIVLYEAAGQCVFANSAAARIIGAPPAELTKLNYRSIPSWARSGLLALAERAVGTGQPQRQSIHMVTSFGKEVTLDCFVSRVTSRGKPHLLVLVDDETQQLEALQALRESESRFRSIVEAVPDAIFLAAIDDGILLDANPAACALLRRTRAEIIGQHHTWVHSPRSRERADRTFAARATETGGSPPGPLMEFVFLRADGTEVQVEGASTEIRVGGRRLRMGVFRDVTARKAAEEEVLRHREHLEELVGERTAALQESYRRLQVEIERRREMEAEVIRAQKFESLGILAGGIAHDFNNALTGIVNNILIAKRELAPGLLAHERLEAAASASLRARSLTHQLLTFSRGGRPVKRCLHLGPIIIGAAEFALRGARSRCEFTLDPDLLPVEVDEGQLEQVIGNLVINADQAMADGGVIRVGAANAPNEEIVGLELPPGVYVRVTVADSGHGVAPEHLTRIFDPYFTTKSKGSGLGLATTYSIVRNHGGLVTVQSAPGEGAVFSVYLPASSAVPVAVTHPEPSLQRRAGRRILVMDDDEDILDVVTIEAGARGYDIATAGDGAEAVRLFAEAAAGGPGFDAVVLDLTVPGGMGGREAFQRMRAIDPEVRVILASGYSHDSLLADAHIVGIARVVPKPYELRQLFAAIEEIC